MNTEKFWKRVRNEEGSVLAFSVVVLTLMIFMASVISITTVNRIAIAKKVSENSREMSGAENINANIDKAIQSVVLQTDELTRYYIARRYFEKNEVNGFTSGVKPEFDESLRILIDSTFQRKIHEVYTADPGNGNVIADIAELVFAHMLTYRTGDSALAINGGGTLESFELKIRTLIEAEDVYQSGGGYNHIQVQSEPTFDNSRYDATYEALSRKRNGININDRSYLNLKIESQYKMPKSGEKITADIEVLFTFPEYQYTTGPDVSSPNDSETLYDNVIHYNKNILEYQD